MTGFAKGATHLAGLIRAMGGQVLGMVKIKEQDSNSRKMLKDKGV